MEIKIINKSNLPLPKYETEEAAGMDLRANNDITIVLRPMDRLLIPTGVHIQLPKGYEGQIRGRSGLAHRNGIGIVNGVGTVDSDYIGELKVNLINFGNEPFTIKNGDRIAQLVISPIVHAKLIEVEVLEETERGNGGFGSTGL